MEDETKDTPHVENASSENNLNKGCELKSIYLLVVGSMIAVVSSIVTTIATKAYEKYENRKVLLYEVKDMGKHQKAEKVYQEKRCNIYYTGPDTINFVIYFIADKGYSISDVTAHATPEELPPSTSRVNEGENKGYIVSNFRETQELDFDINIAGC